MANFCCAVLHGGLEQANPAKKEEEFPELRPATGVSTSNQSSNDTSSAGLSIADRLKLRQLYLTYPSCSRGTIRQLYLSNDRSAHNVMTILGFSQPGLSARVTSRQSPPPPLAPVTSPGSNTSSSSATPSVRTGTTDSRTDEDTTESKRNGRKGNYVPWTVVDSGRKQKKQQPQRYIPGLNQPDDVVTPETNTEAYWREQAVFAKQRMRESFLQAAQLRRYDCRGFWLCGPTFLLDVRALLYACICTANLEETQRTKRLLEVKSSRTSCICTIVALQPVRFAIGMKEYTRML